jgi:hypothetical protein
MVLDATKSPLPPFRKGGCGLGPRVVFPAKGAEKGPAGGKRTLKGRVISSFQRKPEPKVLLNYLIFKVKHWTPGLRRGDGPTGFYCKVGIPILFQHPPKGGSGVLNATRY